MTPDDLERAAAVLREASEVAIACHVNPDADALGSMLGLAHHLVDRGAKVTCAYPNQPQRLPRWSEMLPGLDLLVAPGQRVKVLLRGGDLGVPHAIHHAVWACFSIRTRPGQ